MKMENGNLASNDKQNVDVFAKHFNKVYNNKHEQFSVAANFIRQREIAADLNDHISIKEFDRAIAKLRNGGAPGITEVPPEAFKCLEGENQKQVYLFVVDFWEGRGDYAQ